MPRGTGGAAFIWGKPTTYVRSMKEEQMRQMTARVEEDDRTITIEGLTVGKLIALKHALEKTREQGTLTWLQEEMLLFLYRELENLVEEV